MVRIGDQESGGTSVGRNEGIWRESTSLPEPGLHKDNKMAVVLVEADIAGGQRHELPTKAS
jgi:hypothetical protein